MIFIKSLVFVLILQSSFAYSYKNKLAEIIDSKIFRLDQNEKEAGKAFYTLFFHKDFKLDEALEKMKSSPILQEFFPWAKKVAQIIESNDFETYQQQCSTQIFFIENDYLGLNENLQNLCHKKILTLIESAKKIPTSTSSLKNIEHGLKLLTEQKKWDQLENLINLSKVNKSNHKRFSEIILQQASREQTLPSQKLLSKLTISSQQKRKIQTLKQKNKLEAQLKSEVSLLIKRIHELKDGSAKNLKYRTYLIKKITSTYARYEGTVPFSSIRNKLVILGKDLAEARSYRASQNVFNYIEKKVSPSYKNEALFLVVWNFHLQKRFKEAIGFIKNKNLDDKFSSLPSKLQFWIAYSFEKNKKINKALSFYELILKTNPLSFYSVMGYKKITQEKASFPLWITETDINALPLKKIRQSKDLLTSLKRLQIWSELEVYTFSSKESRRIDKLSKNLENKEFIEILKASLIQKSQNHLANFILFNKKFEKKELTPSRDFLKILYPRLYFSHLKKYQKNIDPLVPMSLMRQESAFNPNALSHAGAVGLMQLMPGTARVLAQKRVSQSKLKDPAINIPLGMKYFQQLQKRYDGNLVYTLAAYNAGEHRVDRWVKNFLNFDSMLLTIESIPYKETRKYVKYIFRNIFFYKSLYQKNPLKTNPDLNHIFDVELYTLNLK